MVDPAYQSNHNIERFSQNAFRMLGLPGDANQADIQAASAAMRRAIKLGVEKSTPWDFPRLGPLHRTEESIRNALGCLANPQQRIRERFFWFIEKETCIVLKDFSFSYSGRRCQMPNLSHLPGWGHDSTILEFLTTITVDPQMGNLDRWTSILQLWSDNMSGEAYWQYFKEVELRGGFEPVAGEEEFHAIEIQTERFVEDIIASIARNAMSQNNIILFQRSFDLLQNADIDARVLSEIESDLLGPIEDELDILSQNIENRCSEGVKHDNNAISVDNKRICEAAVARFRKELEPRFNQLMDLCGKDSFVGKRIAETVATCLYHLAVEYTWADEFAMAEKLALDARNIAPQDGLIFGKIDDFLERIKNAASHERIGNDLEPIDTAPALETLNGFGCRTYGRTDYDPATQSYLTTYYVTAFFIPIFPIRRYRVKDAPGGGWYFLAKAPLRKFERWYRGLVLAAITILIILIIFSVAGSSYISESESTNGYESQSTSESTSTQSDPSEQALNVLQSKITACKSKIENLRSKKAALKTEHDQLKLQMDDYESQLDDYKKHADSGMDVYDEATA